MVIKCLFFYLFDEKDENLVGVVVLRPLFVFPVQLDDYVVWWLAVIIFYSPSYLYMRLTGSAGSSQ